MNIEQNQTIAHLAKLSGLKIDVNDVSLQEKLSSIIALIDDVKSISIQSDDVVNTSLNNDLMETQQAVSPSLSREENTQYSLMQDGYFLAPKSIS